MDIKVVQADEFKTAVADIISALIDEQSDANICFPTGDSPKEVYDELSSRVESGQISLENVRAIGLDEMGELDAGDPKRCISRITSELYEEVNFPQTNIYYLEPNASDVDEMCSDYEALVRNMGGLDLSLLGIGMNGHVGFNEPGSDLNSKTRRVALTDTTRTVSKKYGLESVPQWGVTLGLQILFESKQVVLIANGAHKADIIQQVVDGPQTPQVPASLLRQHPNCILIVDTDAASKLRGHV